MRAWIGGLTALLLVGCANTPEECDPGTAGFFDGISCQTSGAYDEEARQLDQKAEAKEREASALDAELESLRSEEQRNQKQIAALERRVSAIDDRLADMRERLRDARQEKRASIADLQELERDLTAMQARHADLKAGGVSAGESAEVAALEKEIDQTFEEIDVLVGPGTVE